MRWLVVALAACAARAQPAPAPVAAQAPPPPPAPPPAEAPAPPETDIYSGLIAAPPPTVAIGDPKANGDLDKAVIRRYVKRNIDKIQACYESELTSTPKLAGTLTVQFVIDRDGNVASASASGLGNTNVETCVAGVIKAIVFPRPKGGGSIQVNYPFTFRPSA